MLEIKNLHVTIDRTEILKGVTITLEQGKVHALMGPNGSGKSTLAKAIMGSPDCEITQGDILLDGESILALPPHERARTGLFMSFQYPYEIPGVTISSFLRTALNAQRDEKIGIPEFEQLLRDKMRLLNIDYSFADRYLNEGFSGGEKKRAEILQMLVLNPKVAILDETDSGLDIDALKTVANGINLFKSPEKSILVITHHKKILDYLKPDKLSIIIDGKIIQEGPGSLASKLEEQGYEWITEE